MRFEVRYQKRTSRRREAEGGRLQKASGGSTIDTRERVALLCGALFLDQDVQPCGRRLLVFSPLHVDPPSLLPACLRRRLREKMNER